MTYATAKAARDTIEARYKAAARKLKAYPTLPNGLTPDSAKTDQWRRDRQAANAAFQELRRFNAWFTKAYAAEIRVERRNRSIGQS
jgi:hypothetical protein